MICASTKFIKKNDPKTTNKTKKSAEMYVLSASMKLYIIPSVQFSSVMTWKTDNKAFPKLLKLIRSNKICSLFRTLSISFLPPAVMLYSIEAPHLITAV